jgi:hypothetical protein
MQKMIIASFRAASICAVMATPALAQELTPADRLSEENVRGCFADLKRGVNPLPADITPAGVVLAKSHGLVCGKNEGDTIILEVDGDTEKQTQTSSYQYRVFALAMDEKDHVVGKIAGELTLPNDKSSDLWDGLIQISVIRDNREYGVWLGPNNHVEMGTQMLPDLRDQMMQMIPVARNVLKLSR